MPDISMCTNQWCPNKEKCYRYTAIPSGRQSYSSFTYDFLKKSCTYFWDNCNELNNVSVAQWVEQEPTHGEGPNAVG